MSNVAFLGDRATGDPVLDVLVEAGILDQAAARRVAQNARYSNDSVVAIVHQLALAEDALVASTLSQRFSIRRITGTDVPTEPLALSNVNPAFLRRHRALPLGWSGESLRVGVIDPVRSDGLAAISFAAGCAAEPVLMSASEQARAFDALYGANQTEAEHPSTQEEPSPWAGDAVRLRDQLDGGPAVRLVETILDAALEQDASDIHFEPLPDRLRVRFRIDGALETVREEPIQLAAPIAARIKVLADMDIADRRRAQDGRTSLAAKGRPVDVRVSTVPSVYGETVALRLLRRDVALLDLRTLGFADDLLGVFERVLDMRKGLFLVAGPTGSGKTTTLYAMIERLRQKALKILSIEDPIEYFFPDITQVQVNEDAGVTFPSALRSFLRQDPDIILIGEIRDQETARIAVQAALTGHLVLATIHTNDGPSVVERLVDMGVDRYLIAATLAGAVAQRLLRRLCSTCKRERTATAADRDLLYRLDLQAPSKLFASTGCDACRRSGFKGRVAVGEGFIVNDAVREVIASGQSGELVRVLASRGFASLALAAARCALKGDIETLELHCMEAP